MKNKGIVKFVDLFAGLGGIRLGFEQAFKKAGFNTQCVLTSEIKPAAIKALTTNFGAHAIRGDITTVACREIEDFDISAYVSEDIDTILSGGAKGVDTIAEI